ncbi:Uncharacterised protein [Mycobacteroides abscessus subsp. abscessus]|nr:Uncharacterised protein [Mycobacteroides abscessus subsp. abscessus]
MTSSGSGAYIRTAFTPTGTSAPSPRLSSANSSATVCMAASTTAGCARCPEPAPMLASTVATTVSRSARTAVTRRKDGP